MKLQDIHQTAGEGTQVKPVLLTRDEFIMPNVKKTLKRVKGVRTVEILTYYNDKGEVIETIEQFWIPNEQDMHSDKWVKE